MIARTTALGLVAAALVGFSAAAYAADIQIVKRAADPYGSPRPAPGQEHVALRSTICIELTLGKDSTDEVLPESVTLELEPAGGAALPLVRPNRQLAEGCAVRFTPNKPADDRGATLVIYVDRAQALAPATRYTLRLAARSRAGATLPAAAGTWQFTTAAEPQAAPLAFDVALSAPAVHWQGGFFTGICNVAFASSHTARLPTYELMAEIRKTSPRAWSLKRDFWLTGMDVRPGLFDGFLPNIVRERETRRIRSIDDQADGSLLAVEDFFGHEQYGIASNRPLSGDYHPGDEILVADGEHDARAKVVRVDDAARTVLVSGLKTPAEGWKLEYAGPLPKQENPKAPGLFPPGGCYLRKFNPCGTPHYYWGRVDKEWDLDVRQGRRLVVNFTDAPGDVALDGRNWTTAKDYVELHETTRVITDHLIERYGDKTLTFVWSIFNEPDLGSAFWRTDWNELQKFYDYSVDGVLRAFEDRGYDSSQVYIGGLELGGIFGIHLKIDEFLAHCSPAKQEIKGALEENAAFADPRLDGKRSRRVEKLCRTHEGRGSPCDFISIHAYNAAKLMADKLLHIKRRALEIDSEFYAGLGIHSHESTPSWQPPPDPAYSDSFLGNGYYPTWCAEVARRLLVQAADDPRYSRGESVLTVWPWPIGNFGGINNVDRTIDVDDDGDGRSDRQVNVAMPIMHFLALLARMGPEYYVLKEQTVGNHAISGLVSPEGDALRVLVYSHDQLDAESRSEASFDVALRLAGVKGAKFDVKEYRFDKDHNSYFRQARALRDAPPPRAARNQEFTETLRQLTEALKSDQAATQLQAIGELDALGPEAEPALGAVYGLLQRAKDAEVREKAIAFLTGKRRSQGFPAEAIREIQELSELHQTGSSTAEVAADGVLTLTVPLAANGAVFLELEPSAAP